MYQTETEGQADRRPWVTLITPINAATCGWRQIFIVIVMLSHALFLSVVRGSLHAGNFLIRNNENDKNILCDISRDFYPRADGEN